MQPPARKGTPRPGASHTDPEGVYHQHGRISYTVIGTYIFLILIVLILFPSASLAVWWAPEAIVLLLLFFLARYLSTSYSISDTDLRAWRIVGSRRIRLEDVRQIEYSSMRDLGPTGFFGSWGWRGRMWSPRIGHFDAIYTDPSVGLLVSAGEIPVYISPVDVEGFARELSRRVRSYTGPLSVDVGGPAPSAPSPKK